MHGYNQINQVFYSAENQPSKYVLVSSIPLLVVNPSKISNSFFSSATSFKISSTSLLDATKTKSTDFEKTITVINS